MVCITSSKGEISDHKSSLGHLPPLVDAIMAFTLGYVSLPLSLFSTVARVGLLWAASAAELLHRWRPRQELAVLGSQIGRLPSMPKHFFLSCWVACDICS